MKKPLCALALGCALAAPALAAGLDVSVEIPRLNVAEYHRPYVAIWVEPADAKADVPGTPATLAVWYDVRVADGDSKGTKWLKDMRQWWRRAGRNLDMPVDGVSGATRPSGVQTLSFTAGSGPLPKPPAGIQQVSGAGRGVDARGHGLSEPSDWPPKAAAQAQAQGSSELGAVRVTLKP